MRSAVIAAFLFPALAPGAVLANPAVVPDVPCYSSDDYSVAVLENANAVGARFAVSAVGEGGTCRFDESGPAQIIGDGQDPLWFSDLQGKFLILSRSTGPQGDLVVYDLQSGVSVLDVPSDDFEAYPTGVSYWQRTATATPQNCPDYATLTGQGLGAAIVERAHYDFASGTIDRSHEQRCDPVQ
jgi:hypothetical protein